jgi:asparagine synthase (glutamine-hydrolysing)
MCGFIGQISRNSIIRKNFEKSNQRIVCRGPDKKCNLFSSFQEQFNIDEDFNIGLIFNRLSIIDLYSEFANQPMVSKHQKSIVMFNGEIYNHNQLRKDLENNGIKFKTKNSDSEVVFNGLSKFGISYIEKFVGQFAIFYLDAENMKIYLIRDRFGQKPLFYSISQGQVRFSSNLESLSDFTEKKVDAKSLSHYINFGVVPSPSTIYKNIYKVKPSHYIEIDLNNFKENHIKYWNIENYIGNSVFNDEVFHEKFSKAVKHRLVSDVPVANFLSGGLDSSSIVKKIFELETDSINTFTVGVKNKKYNEANWAKLVAEKYNTNHKEIFIDSQIKTSLVFDSLNAFDEPYSDPSTIPTYIISKLISDSFKVAISGDGGDELLGGYLRTRQVLKRLKLNESLVDFSYGIYPPSLGSGQNLLSRSTNFIKSYSSYFEDLKLLELLNIKKEEANYFYSTNYDLYKNLILSDYNLYLPEMMMLKIDRASMANSLEVRSPFVDHKLVEYVLSVDSKTFVNNPSKTILKKYMSQDFNEQFLNRKKQGFVFDLENWVFNNINMIDDKFKDGGLIYSINSQILRKLSRNKSRTNALRLWKLLVIENYLNRK